MPTSASSTRRVGLIARATAQGLGSQTRNFYDGYRPDATLVVRTGATRFKDYLEWYPDAHVAELKRDRKGRESLVGDDLDEFMNSIDVLFSVETLYAWPFAAELRNRGIHTVIQGNPEFYRPPGTKGAAPEPHQWVWPTDWMLAEMPSNTVLAVPVTGRCTARAGDPHDGPLTFVHVAGKRAIGDRNGTDVFCDALRYLRGTCRVRLYGQDGEFRRIPEILPPHVTLEVNAFGVEDRWDLYDGAHVLVLPRIYGGLSLPVQEAMEAGLAVLMTDCPPNRTWPIIPLPCSVGPSQRTPGGHVRTHVVRARALAYEMDRLSMYRAVVVDHQAQARAWARQHTWGQLRRRYDKILRFASTSTPSTRITSGI